VNFILFVRGKRGIKRIWKLIRGKYKKQARKRRRTETALLSLKN